MKTILVAEDNENDIFFIGRAFKKAGLFHSLLVVQDGDAAINFLAGSDPYGNREDFPLPGLVLLDIRLPRRGGIEVLKWIRARPELRAVPVVMLTTSADAADIRDAYDAGANSYLVKPVGLERFAELLQSVTHYWLELNVLC